MRNIILFYFSLVTILSFGMKSEAESKLPAVEILIITHDPDNGPKYSILQPNGNLKTIKSFNIINPPPARICTPHSIHYIEPLSSQDFSGKGFYAIPTFSQPELETIKKTLEESSQSGNHIIYAKISKNSNNLGTETYYIITDVTTDAPIFLSKATNLLGIIGLISIGSIIFIGLMIKRYVFS